MDFTIITPSLNYGKYLAECLFSVTEQADVSLEHLVFDAGSTDESALIASEFPEITWFQGPDFGMSHAINKGFDLARGDWIIWLNADDRLKPNVLRLVLKELCVSDSDIVYGDYDFINQEGELIRFMLVPRWSNFVHVHHHCYVPSTSAFYRNKTIISSGYRLHNEFRYVMDGEFFARLAMHNFKFQHININVADFRMHGMNASQRHLAVCDDIHGVLAAERQHVESRTIRRVYGITLFKDPYLNGLVDGILWITARFYKLIIKFT